MIQVNYCFFKNIPRNFVWEFPFKNYFELNSSPIQLKNFTNEKPSFSSHMLYIHIT